MLQAAAFVQEHDDFHTVPTACTTRMVQVLLWTGRPGSWNSDGLNANVPGHWFVRSILGTFAVEPPPPGLRRVVNKSRRGRARIATFKAQLQPKERVPGDNDDSSMLALAEDPDRTPTQEAEPRNLSGEAIAGALSR